MTSAGGRRTYLGGIVIIALALMTAPAAAQDFRGGIAGTVTDTTGGVLPGATVTVTNTETGIGQNVVTDAQGLYQVRYLNAGTYQVAAELMGFKKVIRWGYQVRVGDIVRVDIAMETGGISETITVAAESPLLNTTTGISGATVDSQQIAQLPLGDGTAYMLTRLAPGIMDSSDLHFARPADNGNLGGIVANGTQGGNEFSIDGAPNQSNAKGVGFSPPSDAIAEFVVQTNAFDAQAGHTAGAVVNLALKSGTNALHGAAGSFNRNDRRSATPLLTERAGGTKPTREYGRYTGTVGGPIVKDKTFFMVSSEHLRDVQPEPATYTVPTEKMRRGDFSEFTTQIFDPFTATGATGARTAFAGNVIPSGRINPVASAYTAFYPAPNRSGTEANYFTNQLRPYNYNAFMGRLDHNFTSSNRIFATAYFNKRQEDRYNWAQDASNASDGGIINGFAITKGFDYRTNTGLNAGYTSTLSSKLLLDVRASFTRFGEYRDPAEEFDPAKLGFPASTLQLMNGYKYLPLFTIGSFSTTNSGSTVASLGSQRADWGDGFDRPMTTFSLAPTLTRVWGGHTARLGYDLRLQRWSITSSGYRRTVRVQRRLHAREQLSRFERPGTVLRAVPAGAPHRGQRQRRHTGYGVEPVRDRGAGRVQAALSRALRAGRLARQLEAHPEPRRPARGESGSDRSGESQPRGLRHDRREPDPGRRSGRVCPQPNRGDPREQLQDAGWPALRERPYVQHADESVAARRVLLSADRPNRRAWRRRALFVRPVLRQHQPAGLLASHAGAHLAGQRPDIHRRHAHEPHSERQPDPARRFRARSGQRARPESHREFPRRRRTAGDQTTWSSRIDGRRTTPGGNSASSTTSVQAGWPQAPMSARVDATCRSSAT